jgi:CRISPR system Cascade subunit CasA
MSFSFSLIDEAWIPCVAADGNSMQYLGIRDTLLRAHELREVCDPSPLVTVCLHRLLLAVLYRALAPVETQEQWVELWEAKRFLADRIESYLTQWRDRFDLFSAEHPFCQTAGLTADRPDTVTRLATELASGHNPTLFDHHSDDALPSRTPADAARRLVAAQAYALGFGKSGRVQIGAVEVAPPYSTDAILTRGVTVWLAGDNLFETLLLNLVPVRGHTRDRPAWELEPGEPEKLMDGTGTDGRKVHAAQGVLDRLTWQSRRVLLLPEDEAGATIVRRLYFSQGRSGDRSPDDPMKAYKREEAEGFVPVRLSGHKAAWRDLHTLLVWQEAAKRPAALNHVAELVRQGVLDARRLYSVNVVGLATAPNKAGKFVLWRHDRVPIRAALAEDQSLAGEVENATRIAEEMAGHLRDRVRRVCRLFLAPDSDRPQGRSASPEDATRLLDALDPRRTYWARLEARFYELLRGLADDPDGASDRWMDAVEAQARTSLQEACRALGISARALRAVAKVPGSFRVPGRLDSARPAEPPQEAPTGRR